MGSKDNISKMIKPKQGAKPRKAGPVRRRTRMFALEPRVLFDGALLADIVSEAGKVADAGAAQSDAAASQVNSGQADAAAKSDAIPGADQAYSIVPATTNDGTPRDVAKPAAAPAQADANRSVAESAQKTSEFDRVSDAVSAPAARIEIVFVDTSVEDYQALTADLNPNATVVLLDGSRDGVQQIADYLAAHENVDAIHIVSHGSAGALQLGTAVLTRLRPVRVSRNFRVAARVEEPMARIFSSGKLSAPIFRRRLGSLNWWTSSKTTVGFCRLR